jgi:hypothetical protein
MLYVWCGGERKVMDMMALKKQMKLPFPLHWMEPWVCVCVCVCACVRVCVYTHTHTPIYIHIYDVTMYMYVYYRK